MQIIVHRGQNQIGGSVIEISTAKTRIILDTGMELQEDTPHALDIPGLFNGESNCDAILISHYHLDHLGLLSLALPEIPVCMGKPTYEIYKFSQENNPHNSKPREVSQFFIPFHPFDIGDIRITPIPCDHSAFDSYMLLLEAEDKKILYTGDFRATGRQNFNAFLKRLPSPIDILITEGTTLNRDDITYPTEEELEKQAEEAIRQHTGPVFVVMPATNIARLVTMFKAAIHCKRIFAYDIYAAQIALRTGNSSIPNINTFDRNLKVFTPFELNNNSASYQFLNNSHHKIGINSLGRIPAVISIRSSMHSWLKKFSEKHPLSNSLLIYSMWDGYITLDDNMKCLLSIANEAGMDILTLHTSGHADTQTIQKLIDKVKPNQIIPVHTENAQWFSEHYGEERVINTPVYNI